jgi:hypothetical protein
MKKDKFRRNSVSGLHRPYAALPGKNYPQLKPGDIRNIEITRLSKSKKSGFFVLAAGK